MSGETRDYLWEENDFFRAEAAYMPGELLLKLGQEETSEDDPRRIQVTESTFILPPRLIYHSCVPNAYIDWQDMSLKALRAITNGERITVHYGTSEYDYGIAAFACDCGNITCVEHFGGFKCMVPWQQEAISAYLSPYLRSVMDA
jgi:hypothetical protein